MKTTPHKLRPSMRTREKNPMKTLLEMEKNLGKGGTERDSSFRDGQACNGCQVGKKKKITNGTWVKHRIQTRCIKICCIISHEGNNGGASFVSVTTDNNHWRREGRTSRGPNRTPTLPSHSHRPLWQEMDDAPMHRADELIHFHPHKQTTNMNKQVHTDRENRQNTQVKFCISRILTLTKWFWKHKRF